MLGVVRVIRSFPRLLSLFVCIWRVGLEVGVFNSPLLLEAAEMLCCFLLG